MTSSYSSAITLAIKQQGQKHAPSPSIEFDAINCELSSNAHSVLLTHYTSSDCSPHSCRNNIREENCAVLRGDPQVAATNACIPPQDAKRRRSAQPSFGRGLRRVLRSLGGR